MTIRHFQIFKAVCDYNGITAAAEQLNITQPTVSIAIKELENFYNTSLFDRINRKIYLTDSGKILQQYTESILDQYNEVTTVLNNGKLLAKCRLGVNISFAESHLGILVNQIKEQLPDCDLHITIQNNEQLESLLSDNKIDLVIYDGIKERKSKQVLHLFKDEMVILAAPKCYNQNSITMSDLSHYPLLMREKGSGVRSCVDRAFLNHDLLPKIIMESSSTMSLVQLAEQGLGFAFASKTLALSIIQKQELQLVTIEDEKLYRHFYLAHNQTKHLSETMRTIKNIAVENCAYPYKPPFI